MGRLRLKRVYEPLQEGDGYRVLVDRLWPRGLTRETAGIDLWLKDIAPSKELREWFGHDPARWSEFRSRYFAELAQHPRELEILRARLKDGFVTLLFAARDLEHNQAVVLAEYLKGHRTTAGHIA